MTTHDPHSVGAQDAQARFPDLLERVSAGEEITITRLGAPVARLVPVRETQPVAQRRTTIDRIKKIGQTTELRGLKISDLIAAGRR